MIPYDGDSNSKLLGCSRMNVDTWSKVLQTPVFDIESCAKCFGSVLPAEENVVNGREVNYQDDMPTEVNLTSLEIELLFNRFNNKSMDMYMEKVDGKVEITTLSDDCETCKNVFHDKKDIIAKHDVMQCAEILGSNVSCPDAYFNQFLMETVHFYEGLGYYDLLGEDVAEKLTKPKNELLEMMEVSLTFSFVCP
jgi:hypothetical protein